jgi:hypothetical protein
MYILFKKNLPTFSYKLFFIICIFIVGFYLPNFAQTIALDSALQQKSLANVQAFYTKSMGGNLLIYNGREYHQEKYATTGHPFFLSDTPMIGTIMYKNVWYTHMHLLFDITSSMLIIKDDIQNNGVVVQSNWVTYFTIGNHRFEYITSSNEGIVSTGFYERITGSTTALFVKRTKHFEQALKAEDNTTKFVERNDYFLTTKNRIYGIANKKSLLKFLADKKELLQQFITDNNINFKRDLENAFEKTISYYNLLN